MGALTLFYDGRCRLCLRTVDALSKLRLKAELRMIPLQQATDEQLPAGIRREELLTELHVVDGSGQLYRGADAIARILREARGLSWLAGLSRLPLLRPLVRAGYRLIAKHRYRLFGTVIDCEDGSCRIHASTDTKNEKRRKHR